MLRVRIAADNLHIAVDALPRRVPSLLFICRSAVNLLELGIVNISTERVLDRFQVDLVTIRGILYAVANSLRAIFHEILRPSAVATAYKIRNHQFGISVNSCPRPNVAPSRCLLFRCNVLGLSSDKFPNFIALQTAHFQFADRPIVIVRAGATEFSEQPNNRVLCHACNADRGADAVAFYEAPNYLGIMGSRTKDVCPAE